MIDRLFDWSISSQNDLISEISHIQCKSRYALSNNKLLLHSNHQSPPNYAVERRWSLLYDLVYFHEGWVNGLLPLNRCFLKSISLLASILLAIFGVLIHEFLQSIKLPINQNTDSLKLSFQAIILRSNALWWPRACTVEVVRLSSTSDNVARITAQSVIT